MNSAWAAQFLEVPFEKELLLFLETRKTELLVMFPYWLTNSKRGPRFNPVLFNAVTVYVGKHTAKTLESRGESPTKENISRLPMVDLFMHLAHTFCNEGRYLLFRAMADQLRHPSVQTEIYSQTLIYIFSRTDHGIVCEIMTRVMVERLIALPPHSPGLVSTFTHIIRDDACDFWSLPFASKNSEFHSIFRLILQRVAIL
uniref:Not1 domain-containing protein n=1 Tax=Steinernema glaseri TaxID=37863 RepID=A0A1I7Y1V5_9BILA